MKKILVIIDMQNDFIDGPLGTPEARAIVPSVVDKIKTEDTDTLILFTKDTHHADYLNTQEGKNLPIKHCIINSGGWCINKNIRSEWFNKSERREICYDDETMNNTIIKDTFGSEKLCQIIRWVDSFAEFDDKVNIKEIELVGVCTDICVISNAMILKSYFPEIQISVDAKCCAGVTPERNRIALEAMKACQINVKE